MLFRSHGKATDVAMMGLYIQLVFRGAKAEPHQNITATVAVCLSMHLHILFSFVVHPFFLHMIEEIYDRNASLSIYQKKYLFTSMCGLQ